MKTKKIVITAVMISMGMAISWICQLIPFLTFPFGGTITLGSLIPIILVSYFFGIRWGLFSGFIYGILQACISIKPITMLFLPNSESYMGWEMGILVILIDYIFAFSIIGIGGVFRKNKSTVKALTSGTILSISLSYIFHVISGFLFYGSWANWFFCESVFRDTAIAKFISSNITGFGLSVLYSVIYNGCYMLPELIISTIIIIPLSKIFSSKKIGIHL